MTVRREVLFWVEDNAAIPVDTAQHRLCFSSQFFWVWISSSIVSISDFLAAENLLSLYSNQSSNMWAIKEEKYAARRATHFPCFKLKRMKGKISQFSPSVAYCHRPSYSYIVGVSYRFFWGTWKRRPGSWSMCQDGRSARTSTPLADGCLRQPVNLALTFGDRKPSSNQCCGPCSSSK